MVRDLFVGLPVSEKVDLMIFVLAKVDDEVLIVAYELLLLLMLLVVRTEGGPALLVLAADLSKHSAMELE